MAVPLREGVTQVLPLSSGRGKYWSPTSWSPLLHTFWAFLSSCLYLPSWSMSYSSHPWIQCLGFVLSKLERAILSLGTLLSHL